MKFFIYYLLFKEVERCKEIVEFRFYYLTNSNELYGYNYNTKQYEKVGENVKGCHYGLDGEYYLTNSNELYRYNDSSKQFEKVGEATDVKEYDGRYYITNSNELYKYNSSSNQYEKLEIDVNDITEFGDDYFKTKDNKIRFYYYVTPIEVR